MYRTGTFCNLSQQKAVCEISPLDRNRLRLTTTIHLKNFTTKKF